MHRMIFHLFSFDGTKSAQSAGEGEVVNGMSILFQLFQYLGSEVQAGGRRSHGTTVLTFGIDSLVTFFVSTVSGATDIGGEGERAQSLSQSGRVGIFR